MYTAFLPFLVSLMLLFSSNLLPASFLPCSSNFLTSSSASLTLTFLLLSPLHPTPVFPPPTSLVFSQLLFASSHLSSRGTPFLFSPIPQFSPSPNPPHCCYSFPRAIFPVPAVKIETFRGMLAHRGGRRKMAARPGHCCLNPITANVGSFCPLHLVCRANSCLRLSQ
jgi:hypothetical protein